MCHESFARNAGLADAKRAAKLGILFSKTILPTFSDLLCAVHIQVPSVAVNDHLEVLGCCFISVELEARGNVVEENGLVLGTLACEQEELNGIIGTRLEELKKARPNFEFPCFMRTDQLHDRQHQNEK